LIPYVRNIGGLVLALQSVSPQSSAAGTVTGASIDRFQHNMPASAVVHQAVGPVSGSPSAMSVITSVYHSPDNSTWQQFIPNGYVLNSQTPALTNANSDNSIAVDLTSAMRYIQLVTTIIFTGGTSPAAVVSADLIIGGETSVAAV
jgi:hypothetical protein